MSGYDEFGRDDHLGNPSDPGPQPDPTCPDCRGDGWVIGHENQCYAKGECECSGVQEQCERCRGSGRLDTRLDSRMDSTSSAR